MPKTMNRDEALELIKSRIKNKNTIKHSLAVEAVMRSLARHFKEDEEEWGLVGLLHDADYEETEDAPKEHGHKIAEELAQRGFSPEFVDAIKAHNKATGVKPLSKMAKALHAADPVTGLVVANALVQPNKKIKEVTVDSMHRKFKDKSFARTVERDAMELMVELDLDLGRFFHLALEAMEEISTELEL